MSFGPIRRRLICLGALATLSTAARADDGPAIALVRDDGPAYFRLAGLGRPDLDALVRPDFDAARRARLFSVRVGRDGAPPVAGTYRVVGPALRFEPQFAVERGITYSARFDPAALPTPRPGPAISTAFTIPKPAPVASTVVSHVYPTGPDVPENLLKLYVHFSAPMARGEAYRRVRVLDEKGRAVEGAFLEIGEELWDGSGTRLTLLFDPGRIKRGLVPREEDGPILVAGKAYTFVVDRDWPDAEGNPLVAESRTPYRAGPADESPPDPKSWEIRTPTAGTKTPLVMTSPEPLDHALLLSALTVRDADGRRVAGRVAVEGGETRWIFTPEATWKGGPYEVVAETILEDRAGNSIGRPFEVDVLGPVTRKPAGETVAVPFRVVPAR